MNIKRLAILVILLAGIPALAGRMPWSPSQTVEAQRPPSSQGQTVAPYPPPETPSPPIPTQTIAPYPPPFTPAPWPTASPPVVTVTPIPISPTPTPSPSEWAQQALRYVAERYNIPLKSLLVVNEHERSYPLTGRTFRAFVVLDTRTPESPEYTLLIDLATRRIEEDIAAVQAAEDAAYLARYGKLQPALYDRLQEVTNDTVLPVAIWMAGHEKQRTREEIYAELAAQFPEAAQALARGTKPMDVGDPEVSERIWEAYRRMRAEDITKRTGPLAAWLRGQGFSVQEYAGMPSLTAMLPKRVILEIATRDDVAMIYLIEERGAEAMTTAIPTDRVPAVWRRGMVGSGQRVAILEDGNIDSSVGCLDIAATRNSPQGIEDHKTRVASIAACDADPYRGVAYGAQLVDAGFDSTGWPGTASQQDAVAALQWAIQSPQNADVVNISYGWEEDNNMNWTDRAFDYWAREEYVTIVSAAGNSGASLVSPAKAWNVISVGGTNDHENTNWADDDMASFSSYINPVSDQGDREKPEVVAPAVAISAPGLGGNPDPPLDGTSFAAPQVAGLAALLMDRHSGLTVWPEAVKPIIMASAVHNIDGPSDIPTGWELRDGAGSIDAALADESAKFRQTSSTSPCNSPCWWGIFTTSSSPPVGGSLYRYFNALQGERIRVAISWLSNADPPLDPPNLARDELDTNFNLYVYSPSGQLVGYTASYDNNYELAEFTAPERGQYTIRVYRSPDGDNNEPSNSLGIAWVKDATYLPDVRADYEGWTSEITVRNDGAEPRDINIHLFYPDGFWVGTVTFLAVQPNGTRSFPALDVGSFGLGHAIVDGSEDVSVVVMNIHEGYPYATGSYIGLAILSDTVRLPLLHRNNYGWYSDISIQNAGPSAADVEVQYFPSDSSYPECTDPYNIPVNGSININMAASCVSEPFVGGAIITSPNDQPLAVVTHQKDSISDTPYVLMTYEGFPASSDPNYIPLAMRHNYNWETGFSLQNAESVENTIEIHFYRQDEAYPCDSRLYYLGPNAIHPIYPAPPDDLCPYPPLFVGSAVADSIDDRSFVSIVNQDRRDPDVISAMSYSALDGSTTFAVVPLVMKDLTRWGREHWYTGLSVQNVGDGSTWVTVTYYDIDGYNVTEEMREVAAKSATIFYPAPGDPGITPFLGSAVVTADEPIAVVVNHATMPEGREDTGLSHAALNH